MDDPNNSDRRRRWTAGLSARAATATVAFGLMAGGLAGGFLVSHAATTPSSTATPSAPSTATGTFHSNENATHEGGESAAREAQENAGQMPTVP